MGHASNRVSWIEGRERRIATLLDIDQALGTALVRTDDGRELVLGASEVEQYRLVAEPLAEPYDEWREWWAWKAERDRDAGTGQDEPLPEED